MNDLTNSSVLLNFIVSSAFVLLKNFSLDATCKHPILDQELPIYIANFVLDNYGEGAIFGCPAHDERDFEFAKKYSLPIIKVIECEDNQLPYTGDGVVINSPLLNGLSKTKAIEKIVNYFENKEDEVWRVQCHQCIYLLEDICRYLRY